LNSFHSLSFRARLVLTMMVVVLTITAVVIYVTESNLRADQQKVLSTQFQNQVRSFLALREAQLMAITDRCRALSHSVRLRAALEERDVDDLYRNALSELPAAFEAASAQISGKTHQSLSASFFRFLDANGMVLPPGENWAGIDDATLQTALAPIAAQSVEIEEQSVGFLAVGETDRLTSLHQVVLTKFQDWDGKKLGALVVGFPIEDSTGLNVGGAADIRNGIWLNGRFYIEAMPAADRHLLAQRVAAAIDRREAGNFEVRLQSGSYFLFYQPLDQGAQLTRTYDVCLYPLAASLREARTLRWKIIGLGTAVLFCGLAASSFLARKLSKPVDQIVATSAENVTRRRKAERDLREVNRELEKTLSELKATQQQVIQQERLSALGQMAAGIAHDFNNTLMPILGFADVLLQNPAMLEDKAEARRCLEMLRTSAQDASNVVSRLREFYRPADSDEEFPIVDLGKLIQQAVALTEPKWRGLTQARGITVIVETEFQAHPIVAGDESALREVLTNLLFNAVDAMPQGGRASLQTSIENDRAVLRVTDTGTGMTEAIRRRCLEPFFSTKGEHGTGLGLSMVYGIIERHRGNLEIESEVGKGTTFVIRLPLAAELSVAERNADAIKTDSTLSVLVVDDEARSREVLMAYLRTDQHSVATASSGREGLEKFRRRHFDLVIMDRAMPEMNGEQTAGLMKQLSERVPIILLTGFSGQLDADGAKPATVDLVLNKPITLDDLRHSISKLLYAV
jgi:signal transduction histidine kinase